MSSTRMGLTKQYLRYVPAGNTNIITSPKCNVVFVTLEGQEGRFVAVGACEHVFIWDLRLGEKVRDAEQPSTFFQSSMIMVKIKTILTLIRNIGSGSSW